MLQQVALCYVIWKINDQLFLQTQLEINCFKYYYLKKSEFLTQKKVYLNRYHYRSSYYCFLLLKLLTSIYNTFNVLLRLM
jgi:hypothetical protein